MQENNPAQVVPEVQPVQIVNDQQPKTNNFLVILLSILLFISVAIAAFFAYRTQQLVAELRVNNEESMIETAEPSFEPIATESLEVDPTANWEIYTNSENKYSIKFPKNDFIRYVCPSEELTVGLRGTDNRISPITMASCERDLRYDLEIKTLSSVQKEPEETKYYNIVKKDIAIGGVSGKLYIHTFTNIEDGPYPKWFANAYVTKNNKTYEIHFGDESKLDLFNQILSTFKFTN